MMKKMICVALLVTTTACTSDRLDKSQNYWQRTNTQSALYLTGPKAQYTLQQDIATCVNTLQELQRLGALREAVPPDSARNQVPDYNPTNSRVATNDSPRRDGPLYAEYYDYVDFEGCMKDKGWQRTLIVSPEQRTDAKDNWIRAMVDPNWGGAGDNSSVQKPVRAPREANEFNQ